MLDAQFWFTVKQITGVCEIASSDRLGRNDGEIMEKWGNFSSSVEAIACRIGLIISGHCQPQ